jgi:plastocyanin
VLHLLAAAAVFHDRSKTPFFIAAGVLVAWAILVSAAGIRSVHFPTSAIQGRLVMAVSAVLVVFATTMAVVTAKTPPAAPAYNTGASTNGVAPTVTPVSAAPVSGPLQLSANAQGALAFSTKALAASSSNVTIEFTNKSPLSHNVTIANAKGQVVGFTPTFDGGTKTLTLKLPPGSYTFYCSVPGHEQAGMKGTLTVQ